MNDENEDFTQLQQMLKLKRHEQPPPGYFNLFSQRVITRIEAEARSGANGRTLWDRVRAMLAANPVSAGVFAVCGALIVSIANSQYLDRMLLPQESFGTTASLSERGNWPGGLAALAGSSPRADVLNPSTSPMFFNDIQGSLLDPFSASVQTVGYSVNQ